MKYCVLMHLGKRLCHNLGSFFFLESSLVPARTLMRWPCHHWSLMKHQSSKTHLLKEFSHNIKLQLQIYNMPFFFNLCGKHLFTLQVVINLGCHGTFRMGGKQERWENHVRWQEILKKDKSKEKEGDWKMMNF